MSKTISPQGYAIPLLPLEHPFFPPDGDVPAGRGIPPGGTLGQVLTKSSDGDYDVEWADGGGGKPGPEGPPGKDGAPGKDGLQGPPGPPGEPGDSIAVGSVTTLEPGSDAYVEDGGAPGAVILDFGIPRGKDGAPGKDGIQGPPGEPGKDGAPGKDGIQGPPGPPGEPGKDGAPGKDGIQGPPGKDGAPGANFIKLGSWSLSSSQLPGLFSGSATKFDFYNFAPLKPNRDYIFVVDVTTKFSADFHDYRWFANGTIFAKAQSFSDGSSNFTTFFTDVASDISGHSQLSFSILGNNITGYFNSFYSGSGYDKGLLASSFHGDLYALELQNMEVI